MQKLNKTKTKELKDFLAEVLDDVYRYNWHYQHKLSIKVEYNETYESNFINIRLTMKWKETTSFSDYYLFIFNESYLNKYECLKLSEDGSTFHTSFGGLELYNLNKVCNAIDTFFKGVAKDE